MDQRPVPAGSPAAGCTAAAAATTRVVSRCIWLRCGPSTAVRRSASRRSSRRRGGRLTEPRGAAGRASRRSGRRPVRHPRSRNWVGRPRSTTSLRGWPTAWSRSAPSITAPLRRLRRVPEALTPFARCSPVHSKGNSRRGTGEQSCSRAGVRQRPPAYRDLAVAWSPGDRRRQRRGTPVGEAGDRGDPFGHLAYRERLQHDPAVGPGQDQSAARARRRRRSALRPLTEHLEQHVS